MSNPLSKSLEGLFFKIEGKWQGRVTRQITEEYYLVQLFSWLDGEPTISKLIRLADVTGKWSWFSDRETWVAFGDGSRGSRQDWT